MTKIVGGGAKKILYTLNTVRRIGLLQSAKALSANNACKACGLGMGGQHGGMTNEKGEFPSVCNKSVQAQSTDIQQPIPNEIFDHSIADLKELSGYQMEHLGRLNTPLYKAAHGSHFETLTWEKAIDIAVTRLKACAPHRSFFYSSGRSSNEAGFLLQLFSRMFGTNNVNNCSYYCHQASAVGLSTTIGTTTATIALADLAHCDTFFIIGANPASNHPRLIHQLKALRDRGGKVIVINPAKEPGLVKFSVPKSPSSLLKGGDEIATHYLQPKIGSDVWVMSGIAKTLIALNALDLEFIHTHTENFLNYEAKLNAISWEDIESHSGLNRESIEQIGNCYAQSRHTVFAWGMGVTHHTNGCDNVEAIVNLALLRGMVGKHGAGLLPLRGHSNVQGIGTIGVKPVLARDVIEALEKHIGVSFPDTPGLDTLACLTKAQQGEIDLALLMGGNLYEASPNSKWAEEALDNINFKLYLTTTLNKGHVNGINKGEALILPVTARDEEHQSTTQESMFNYLRLSDGGIGRLMNVRPESSILCEIAEHVIPKPYFDFSIFKSHKNIRAMIAKCVPGMRALAEIDQSKREFHIDKRILHSPVFPTNTQKARFADIHLAPKITADESSHPFTLTTVRSEGQFNTIIYEEHDSYRGVKNRNTLLMNPEDMNNLKLDQNSRVDIRSDFGELLSLHVKPFDIPQGDVMGYYPETNALTGLQCDPRSKTPSFKAIKVAIHLSAK